MIVSLRCRDFLPQKYSRWINIASHIAPQNIESQYISSDTEQLNNWATRPQLS